ncbi:hypothetical protein EDC05_002274 [Coemansia umbellata]|uniref:t-SNARE coiled-coil homology domain-containing protein n=1 Tax=Coemansia umbellata TaxID=1424467 RepID=A0ABQ8PPQ0_9FUNG|nr:hypothetical protein EDC05_002274 [Coemansia umbellata]
MNRSRFSDFVAHQRDNGSGGSGSSGIVTSGGRSFGSSINSDMEKYLTTLNGIAKDIDTASNDVDELGALHGRLLSTADGTKAESIARQRDQKTAQINSLVMRLKSELDAVEQMNQNTQLTPSEEATRRSRHAVLARKLMRVLEKYRMLERESQKRYRSRMERHIRLVRPDATDEEVAEAAANETSRSIFAMDVMSSYQSKVAKRMLRDVENRDKDIREISNTIELLNGMFGEVQELVAQQQDVLDNIEQAVESTHEHVNEGNKMVERAKWYRIKTRKATLPVAIILEFDLVDKETQGILAEPCMRQVREQLLYSKPNEDG